MNIPIDNATLNTLIMEADKDFNNGSIIVFASPPDLTYSEIPINLVQPIVKTIQLLGHYLKSHMLMVYLGT